MALPPTQFVRPRRDPSLVEQAIVALGSGLLRKKFIDDPTAKAKEAAAIADREDKQRHAEAERIAKAKETQAQSRRVNVEQPIELATLEQARRELIPPDPGVVPIRTAQGRLITSLDPDFVPGVAPTSLGEQARRLEAGGDFVDRLLERARTDASIAATQASARDSMLELLRTFSLSPDELKPFMVKDQTTGQTRFPTNDEIGLNQVSVALEIGKIAGIESDARFVGPIARAAELRERTVLVPAYDPQVEVEVMGKVLDATPGADTARNQIFIRELLRSVGLAGGGGPGEKWWFINDAGKKVTVDTEGQFFFEFPTQSRSTIRGALWASVFFQDPSKFEAARQRYGLSDNVAEDTYRKITKSRTPSVFAPGSSTTPSSVSPGTLQESLDRLESAVPGFEPPPTAPTPTTTAKSLAKQAEAFISAGAQAMIEADSNVVGDLEALTSEFLADPTAYDQAIANIEAVLALPDEEFRTVLEESGVRLSRFEKPEGVKGRSPSLAVNPLVVVEGPVPERDALRFAWTQAINVAHIEAQTRRREKSQ